MGAIMKSINQFMRSSKITSSSCVVCAIPHQNIHHDTIICILKLCDITTIHRVMRVSRTWLQASIVVLQTWENLQIRPQRASHSDDNSVRYSKRLSLRRMTRITRMSMCKASENLSKTFLFSASLHLKSLHLDFSLTNIRCIFPSLAFLYCRSADFDMLSRCPNLLACTLSRQIDLSAILSLKQTKIESFIVNFKRRRFIVQSIDDVVHSVIAMKYLRQLVITFSTRGFFDHGNCLPVLFRSLNSLTKLELKLTNISRANFNDELEYMIRRNTEMRHIHIEYWLMGGNLLQSLGTLRNIQYIHISPIIDTFSTDDLRALLNCSIATITSLTLYHYSKFDMGLIQEQLSAACVTSGTDRSTIFVQESAISYFCFCFAFNRRLTNNTTAF